ncbi:hypothetical protein CK203_041171 [Vitis vinifera]|uniref:Retrovirus-related Pol polyprotein from transposon TNT 1-94 n=1 Tax=Vitis vinifera TaxID=29760 RepID=A0A438HTB1_VITVI|nr:hypothetical protein CK203_041171 [Vitis vinifera]
MFQHDSLSIQDCYSAFLTLWHEYADLVTADVPITALSTIQTIHVTTRHDWFLMKLRPEYEFVLSSLLNRSPVPSLDICFGELLREEQRLSTQAILEQSHGSSGTATVAYAAQGRGPPMHSKNLQCFYCKEYGHIAATCPKKFCSYCKKKGHIIKECHIHPQNRQAQAFQTSVIIPPVATSATHDSPLAVCSVPAPPAPDYCTPEMVQRMLISALSAMGFQGKNSTKLWTRLGKSKTLPFPLHASRASHCFDLIHSDVWGPSPTLRTDSGGEYLSTEFQAFLASKGIIHHRSCSSTPQQNGVAERKNRHLLDVSYIWSLPISAYLLSNLVMITFVFFVVYALFIYLLMSDINYLLNLFDVLSWDIMCQKGFVCYDPTLHRTRNSWNVIFFENQHFFPVSSSTMVLPSFEQQFSDLHPISSHFQPGIVYTRRSCPQSLSLAHPISDPTTL